jgi:pimeloyl-ACP methyl ester carboxylesterase
MRSRSLLCCLTAGVLAAGALGATSASAAHSAHAKGSSDVVEIPISFKVKNTNNTDVTCTNPVDGGDYTVNGVVVGPKSAIAAGKAATLYLHAVTWTHDYFDLDIAGHNYAKSMAEKGHVSVLVDRLGYGNSGKPDGLATCFGSAADVAHQMVDSLKAGSYTTTGKAAKYSKVFISGSSVGGLISNIVAYTFKDVDGVYNQSWGDFSAGPYAGYEAVDANERCYKGGDPRVGGGTTSPHYATFAGDSRNMFYFASAPQEVRDHVPPMQPDPCGEIENLPFAIGADMQHLGEINVPVLITFGDADPVFPMGSAEQMQYRYYGSPKVTNVNIPGASHYPILEANFPVMLDAADAWLNENGG